MTAQRSLFSAADRDSRPELAPDPGQFPRPRRDTAAPPAEASASDATAEEACPSRDIQDRCTKAARSGTGRTKATRVEDVPATVSPTHIARSAATWCPMYRHRLAWRSTFGTHAICATCHPPADPELAVEWLQAPAGEPRPFPLGAGPERPKPHALLTDRADDVLRAKAAQDLRRQRASLRTQSPE